MQRELMGNEQYEVRRLVKTMCANYDNKYGCMPLNGQCYMIYGFAYTDTGMCKYFKQAVLPLNSQLEAALNGECTAERIKQCAICGIEIYSTGNKAKYCKPCAERIHRRQKNESNNKKRLKRTNRK